MCVCVLCVLCVVCVCVCVCKNVCAYVSACVCVWEEGGSSDVYGQAVARGSIALFSHAKQVHVWV
jgi:hypothetical protein